MKCDELKPLVFSIADLAYVDEIRVTKNFQNPHDHAVYKATEADEAIAELKTKLAEEREFGLNRAKSADHEIGKLCAELCELKAENRKHQRALWMARAERAKEMAKNFHEKNLVEKCAKWDNVHLMCRAKAEEY